MNGTNVETDSAGVFNARTLCERGKWGKRASEEVFFRFLMNELVHPPEIDGDRKEGSSSTASN